MTTLLEKLVKIGAKVVRGIATAPNRKSLDITSFSVPTNKLEPRRQMVIGVTPLMWAV